MTADRTPTGDLRERLADALAEHALTLDGHYLRPTVHPSTLLAVRENAKSRAAALLPVVEAETAALRTALKDAERERDLAIAHDRQPYPTAWAYEQACRALEEHRKRAEVAEAALAAKDAEISRLRDDLKWARSECAKADAENNAAGKRAEEAEAAVQRVRDLHAPEEDPRRNRDCKGCRTVATFTYYEDCKTLAALDQPKETP